jgi:hypothetical protein
MYVAQTTTASDKKKSEYRLIVEGKSCRRLSLPTSNFQLPRFKILVMLWSQRGVGQTTQYMAELRIICHTVPITVLKDRYRQIRLTQEGLHGEEQVKVEIGRHVRELDDYDGADKRNRIGWV